MGLSNSVYDLVPNEVDEFHKSNPTISPQQPPQGKK